MSTSPEPAASLKIGHQNEKPKEVHLLELAGHLRESRPALGQELEHFALRIRPKDQERAQRLTQAAEELGRIVAVIEQSPDKRKHGRAIAARHRPEDLQIPFLVHQPQHATHLDDLDLAAERQHLIQKRERVADTSIRAARDRHQRGFLGRDLLPTHYFPKSADDLGDRHAPEVEPLAARKHRSGRVPNPVRLCRGEHEDHARRWFLEDLQKRVPRLAREHVRLVDDVHLVAVLVGRCVHGALPKVACIVDPAVGRGVDLDDIE